MLVGLDVFGLCSGTTEQNSVLKSLSVRTNSCGFDGQRIVLNDRMVNLLQSDKGNFLAQMSLKNGEKHRYLCTIPAKSNANLNISSSG